SAEPTTEPIPKAAAGIPRRVRSKDGWRVGLRQGCDLLVGDGAADVGSRHLAHLVRVHEAAASCRRDDDAVADILLRSLQDALHDAKLRAGLRLHGNAGWQCGVGDRLGILSHGGPSSSAKAPASSIAPRSVRGEHLRSVVWMRSHSVELRGLEPLTPSMP